MTEGIEYKFYYQMRQGGSWWPWINPVPNIHKARQVKNQIKHQYGTTPKCFKVTTEEIDL